MNPPTPSSSEIYFLNFEDHKPNFIRFQQTGLQLYLCHNHWKIQSFRGPSSAPRCYFIALFTQTFSLPGRPQHLSPTVITHIFVSLNSPGLRQIYSSMVPILADGGMNARMSIAVSTQTHTHTNPLFQSQ